MSSPAPIEKTCDVCAGILSGSDIFKADCSHSFHFGCISNNHFCPVCQATFNNLPFKAKSDQEPPVFSDDEPLPPIDPMSVCGGLQKVTIKAVPELPSVVSSESVPQFTVLVGLKAPSFTEDDDEDCGNQRAPVDLVTVLDVSGSMYGAKLKLLKRAVHFVIDNLGPNDRLSIVSFETKARRLLPLRRMTDSGRLEAKRAVDKLKSEGSTDIVKGLKKGVRVLEERLHKNPVASIIFLSDGHDTCNYSRGSSTFGTSKGAPEYLKKLPASIFPSNKGPDENSMETIVPVHSFGFGSDHDPFTMHAISEASGGTFSFIEAYQIVQDAFASCIGGLLSVVAQEVRLTVRSASHGVEVKSICSGGIASSISNEGTQGLIDIGDLYADEEKEFLINLCIPPLTNDEDEEEKMTSLLDITCSYRDAGSDRVVKVEGDLVEIRRTKTGGGEEMVVSLEVDRQRNRVIVAETMAKAHEMAEANDLAGARALLAERRKELMGTTSGLAGDELCLWLEKEIEELEKRFGSMHLYNKAGRAFALSGMSSHARQRATTKGNDVEAGDDMPAASAAAGVGWCGSLGSDEDESDDDMGFCLFDNAAMPAAGEKCYKAPPRYAMAAAALGCDNESDDDMGFCLYDDDAAMPAADEKECDKAAALSSDDDDLVGCALAGDDDDKDCQSPRSGTGRPEGCVRGPRLGGAFVTPNMDRMVNKSRQYIKADK